MELTPECNLRCVHCYNWFDKVTNDNSRRDSYRKAFNLLDFIIRNTTIRHITFTGGEPTVNERFVELVLHAKLKGKQVTVITNGNGSPDVYRQLADMKVDMVEISIHSLRPEIHDKITRRPGSWQNAVENMELLLGKWTSIAPVMVISSLNYQYAAETVDFFFRHGIRHVIVNRYNLGGEGLNHPMLSANTMQLKQAFEAIDRYAGERDLTVISGVCTPHCILDPDDYPNIHFGNCSSDVSRRPLTVDLEGNLRMCNHSPVVMGNVYEESLDEIFANPYVSEWDEQDIPFCRDCTRLHRCKGGCRAAAEQVGLSLRDEDPIVNELEGVHFV
jgi:radical SAM protein with 4Fe4S-binding SPASM domain